MKRILTISLLIVAVNTAFTQTAKKETMVVKTSIACDHCMQCESCGANIYNSTLTIPGVKSIDVSPEANTITVIYKTSKTDPDKIRAAIAASGYDADHVKADPAGYLKLDGCCKSKAE